MERKKNQNCWDLFIVEKQLKKKHAQRSDNKYLILNTKTMPSFLGVLGFDIMGLTCQKPGSRLPYSVLFDQIISFETKMV